MKQLTGIAVFLSMAASAHAWQAKPYVNMDLQFGGDTLLYIQYTDGTDQEIKAGNGIVFNGGALVDTPVTGLQLRSTIGYKYSTSQATNVDIAKTAVPIEAGIRYQNAEGIFLEGGLVHHLSPTLSVDDDEVEFESGPGLNVKAGWRFISVGYSQMTYESNGEEFDASSFNIGLEWAFDL